MTAKFRSLSIKKVLITIFYSFVYAFGMQMFLAPASLIATGLAGVSQILTLIFPVVSYGVFYLLINIPGFILGFSKIGYRFTTYSVISVLTVTFTTMIVPVPESPFTSDIILNCVFAGIVMGIGIGGLLKNGASSGGTDFIGIYLYNKYGYDFAKVNLAINLAIIVIAALLFGIEIGLYTTLSFYIRNITIDQVFTSNNKMTVWIIAEDLTRVSTYINQKLGHGTTKMSAVGGYTQKDKEIIMTILTQYEYSRLRDDIETICPDAFINVTETFDLAGNFNRRRKIV